MRISNKEGKLQDKTDSTKLKLIEKELHLIRNFNEKKEKNKKKEKKLNKNSQENFKTIKNNDESLSFDVMK